MKHTAEFERLCEEARARVREISVAETHSKLVAGEAFQFIDVREDHEWQVDHAAGAKHLGRGILERDIANVATPDEEIVLYCGGGYRSALAAENLQKMGYTKVYSMAGGMRAWRAAGCPVEK